MNYVFLFWPKGCFKTRNGEMAFRLWFDSLSKSEKGDNRWEQSRRFMPPEGSPRHRNADKQAFRALVLGSGAHFFALAKTFTY